MLALRKDLKSVSRSIHECVFLSCVSVSVTKLKLTRQLRFLSLTRQQICNLQNMLPNGSKRREKTFNKTIVKYYNIQSCLWWAIFDNFSLKVIKFFLITKMAHFQLFCQYLTWEGGNNYFRVSAKLKKKSSLPNWQQISTAIFSINWCKVRYILFCITRDTI